MVKVNAPMLSLEASGKLGGALVFSKWKGRPYVRSLVTPANPRSGLQVGTRSMFKFLTQNWASLSTPEKATWATAAANINASPFNAYVKDNMTWWRRFNAPSKDPARAAAGTPPVVGTWNVTGGVRHVIIDFDWGTANDAWGIIIFRSPTGTFTPALSNTIAAALDEDALAHQYVDGDLDAGTYYYDWASFTDDGVITQGNDELSATVT